MYLWLLLNVNNETLPPKSYGNNCHTVFYDTYDQASIFDFLTSAKNEGLISN